MKLNNKLIKIIAMIIWFILSIIALVECGLKQFQFTSENFIEVEGALTVILYLTFKWIDKEKKPIEDKKEKEPI